VNNLILSVGLGYGTTSKMEHRIEINKFKKLQSILCTTATLGTLNMRPLLTGGRCSEEVYIMKIEIGSFEW
jgi:hypothetical protein